MIEVAPRLWVGSAADYERRVAGAEGWWVVQACKEPYHICASDKGSRNALATGVGAGLRAASRTAISGRDRGLC